MSNHGKLFGLHEIAAYFGIRRQLANKWTSRSDFPAPRAELAQGRVWNADEVIAWGKRHGREQGSGPRPARAPARR